MYDDSLCDKCGQSGFYALDPHNDGQFEVDDETICLGCEELEGYKADDPWPGTKLRIIRSVEK